MKNRSRRDILCDDLCTEIGLKRKKPGHGNLSKNELLIFLQFVRSLKADMRMVRRIKIQMDAVVLRDEYFEPALKELEALVRRWE